METSKQKTVTFEFSTTDIVPEEMANTFIRYRWTPAPPRADASNRIRNTTFLNKIILPVTALQPPEQFQKVLYF